MLSTSMMMIKLKMISKIIVISDGKRISFLSKESVVGIDQKDDAFWSQIRHYCKENNQS